MKKHLFTVIALILVFIVGLSLFACNGGKDDINKGKVEETIEEPKDDTFIIDDSNLISTDYIDYANTVYLNTEEYPALADMGLTLVSEYSSTDYDCYTEVDADNEDNIRQYFDPTRPSIIIINGVAFGGGRYGRGGMSASNHVAEFSSNLYIEEEELDYFTSDPNSLQTYALSKYWYDGVSGKEKYNIFHFHYTRFADTLDSTQDVGGALKATVTVHDNIWSDNNGVQALYRASNGEIVATESGKAINGYSVAELYAAEYLRAFGFVDELYPDYKNSGKRTYVASHSMGGVMSVAGNVLLKLLSDDGQIPMALTPSRLLQMDSYVGAFGKDDTSRLSWTDKPYCTVSTKDKNSGETITKSTASANYLAALRRLAINYNVAIDFYMNEGYSVPFTVMANFREDAKEWVGVRGEEANFIMEYSAMVRLHPLYADMNGSIITDGHNPIREWVLTSYIYEAPTVTVDGVTYTVPTAAMSNEDVIAARGTYYIQKSKNPDGTVSDVLGSYTGHYVETVRCNDDYFAKVR